MNLRRALKGPLGTVAQPPVEAPKKKGKAKAAPASADLFVWIDGLYTKIRPEGTPPMYVMHRFMASDPDLAQWANELQNTVREAPLMYWVWQGLLPKGAGAPRGFHYTAPKKTPPEEELVARMERVLGENRRNVEAMLELVRAAGREKELYWEFGVKPPTGAAG